MYMVLLNKVVICTPSEATYFRISNDTFFRFGIIQGRILNLITNYRIIVTSPIFSSISTCKISKILYINT